MKIRPAQRLFSPSTGREIRPEIASIQKLEVNNLLDALRDFDPGIARIIGSVEMPCIDARGSKYTHVLAVKTGDPDGNDWNEWVPVDLDAALDRARELRAEQEAWDAAAPARECARAAVREQMAELAAAAPAPAASDNGASYRHQGDPRFPGKFDGQKAAREWAEDAYRSGDSWSDE